MVLYADILFAVNFVMNIFVLWVVAKLTRRRTGWLMVGGAVIMAGLYTAFVAIEALRAIPVAVGSITILSAGIFLAFKVHKFKEYFKLMAVTYCVSFAVGGLGMALVFMVDLPYAVYFLTGDPLAAISWQVILASMFASYICIKLGLKFYEARSLKRQLICMVNIVLGSNQANFAALVDTGHNLREPLSNGLVIIAEFEEVKELLPSALRVLFYEGQEASSLALANSDDFGARIRLVPFSSLGRTRGMLVAFRPDHIRINGENATMSNTVIGIYNSKLCSSGRYSGLLSPEVINNQ